MDDLRRRFASLDQLRAPDLWDAIELRAATHGSTERVTPVVAIPVRSRRSIGRSEMVYLSAAAVLLTVIAGAIIVGSRPDERQPIVPAPVQPPSFAPSVEATASPSETSDPVESPSFAPSPDVPASPSETGDPAVSRTGPNGWIAYTVSHPDANGDEDDDIWLVSMDEDARRVIGTDTDGVDQLCPAFSPDGRSLAYGVVQASPSGLMSDYRAAALVIADVSADGRATEQRTIPIGDALPPPCPVFSGDGAHLAFAVPRTSPINPDRSSEGSEVWVLRLADSDIDVIPDILPTDLEWSPDGSQLAMAGGMGTSSIIVTDGLPSARIHLYTPASGETRTINDTVDALELTWAPDSRRIAYSGASGLRLIDVESGQQSVLGPPHRAVHGIGPVWSPSGETIAYQRALSGEHSEVVLLTLGQPPAPPTEVVLQATIEGPEGSDDRMDPYRVVWSPDGKYLLYIAWTSAQDPVGPVAVPVEPEGAAIVLAETAGIVPYDGYPNTPRVQYQMWGRQPSD